MVQKKGSVEGRRWFEKQSFSDTKHWREERAKVATMDGASDRPIALVALRKRFRDDLFTQSRHTPGINTKKMRLLYAMQAAVST